MNLEEHEGPIPEQIARYKIEGLLTKGGMSLLYLGTHPDTSEPVLIKVLLPKFLKDKEIAARFVNEAKVISKANHPNIVKLYDSGTWEGGLYIAMEFVKGTSLRKILTHQPFSLKRALEILLQIAYALCHLHTHGVIHGDVKPENILITESGQVKLIDFGIAQLISEKPATNGAKRLVGTPVYMSPEQLEQWGNVSYQSDIYSLGIIAYELALGKITHGKVILSLAPKGLQKILHKALQPKIEDRYQDIADFIADLSSYIKGGSYQQDKQGSDYFLELFETIDRFQTAILQPLPTDWNTLDIGLSTRSGMGLSAQYYNFVSLNDSQKAFFIAEHPAKTVEGVLAIAGVRTLFQTLQEMLTEPEKIATMLKSRLSQDPSLKNLLFCYLMIDTKNKTFICLHSGYGLIFEQNKNSSSRELDTGIACITGKLEGRFVFAGSLLSGQELQEALSDAYEQTRTLSCQQQAEALLRRIHIKEASHFDEEPLLIFAVECI